jgi:hypothetical protein
VIRSSVRIFAGAMPVVLSSFLVVGCSSSTAQHANGFVSSNQGADAARAKAQIQINAMGLKARTELFLAARGLEAQAKATQYIGPAIHSGIDFSKADCRKLSESQLESYVDPRITGRVRAMALRDMREQPPCARQNVELVGDADSTYANTWEGLQDALRQNASTSQWRQLAPHEWIDKDGDIHVDTWGFHKQVSVDSQGRPIRSP